MRPEPEAGNGRAGTSRGLLARCAARVLAGAALAAVAPLLDRWSYRPTAPALLAVGLAFGMLAAWGLWRRERERAPRGWIAAAVVLMLLVAVLGPRGGLNGDEPHYAMMARSIVVDGDLDLAGDYDPERRPGHVPASATPHVVAGAESGSAYSFHGHGLAFLLAPVAVVAERLPAGAATLVYRVASVMWLLAAGALVWALARPWVGPSKAGTGALLMVATAPLILQGPHLFPDLPAMVVSACSWWLATGERRRPWIGALLLGTLPWLHFKFLGLFAVQAAALLWWVGRAGPARTRLRERAGAVLLAAAGPAALALTNASLYGSPSLLAGAAFNEVDGRRLTLFDHLADPAGALRTALALLLDQKDGLLFHGPHYLLAVIGAAWLWRRSPARVLWLGALFGSVWLPAALSQNTGLWSPPARWLVGGLWPLALLAALGAVVPLAGRPLRAVRAALITLGLVSTVAWSAAGAAWYVARVDTRSPLLAWLGGPDFELWRLFPLWTRYDEPAWVATLFWSSLAAVLAAWMWRTARRDPASSDRFLAHDPVEPVVELAAGRLALGVVSVTLLVSVALLPTDDPAFTSSRDYGPWRATVSRLRAGGAWLHSGSLWFPGSRRGRVELSTIDAVGPIHLTVHAPVAMEVELRLGTARSRLALGAGETRRLRLDPGSGHRWSGRRWWPLEVSSGGAAPAAEIFGPGDERMLGVAISFDPVGRDAEEGPD